MSRVGKYDLTVVINDIEQPSEVFLIQMLQALAQDHKIEIISFTRRRNLKGFEGLTVRFGFRPRSFSFLLRLPLALMRAGRFNLKYLYRIALVDLCAADKVYVPFFNMLPSLSQALVDLKKETYVSIRGGEVTFVPFVKSGALEEYRQCAKYVKKMHFLSHELHQRTLDLGIKVPDYQVIYQGLNFSKYLKEYELPGDKLRMLCIGRFHYIKGLEFLLLACSLLLKEKVDFSCTIIGYGPEKEKLMYMLYDLGLSERIAIIDHESSKQPITYHLQRSNLYVHPHLVTGLSNSMLEAFASGLHTIAFNSNFDGYKIEELKEYFHEVPRYDHMELAKAIQRFDFKTVIPIEKRKKILETFSLERQVRQFKIFFDWSNEHLPPIK